MNSETLLGRLQAADDTLDQWIARQNPPLTDEGQQRRLSLSAIHDMTDEPPSPPQGVDGVIAAVIDEP